MVDSGAAVTHIVPVFEGISDPHQIKRLNVAGDHVTKRLANLLCMRGYSISSAHVTSGALQRLKERCCYVAVDYAQELSVRPLLPRACTGVSNMLLLFCFSLGLLGQEPRLGGTPPLRALRRICDRSLQLVAAARQNTTTWPQRPALCRFYSTYTKSWQSSTGPADAAPVLETTSPPALTTVLTPQRVWQH